MPESPESPRARYRKQVRDEVQTIAWEQITQSGMSALSLKAIASRMGMTAPALYRYYGSRDELLTEMILSTYADVADVFEAAAGAGGAPGERITAMAMAFRGWAVEHPHRYLLLYGTPVPGYHAPETATALAQRIFAPVLAAFGDAAGENHADAAVLHRSLTFWTRLHGVLSLELAGHFTGMGFDPEEFYRDEVTTVIEPISRR